MTPAACAFDSTDRVSVQGISFCTSRCVYWFRSNLRFRFAAKLDPGKSTMELSAVVDESLEIGRVSRNSRYSAERIQTLLDDCAACRGL